MFRTLKTMPTCQQADSRLWSGQIDDCTCAVIFCDYTDGMIEPRLLHVDNIVRFRFRMQKILFANLKIYFLVKLMFLILNLKILPSLIEKSNSQCHDSLCLIRRQAIRAVPNGSQWCPAPPFQIGTPSFHVWPTGCCIRLILYFKNVAPLLVFGPPCC